MTARSNPPRRLQSSSKPAACNWKPAGCNWKRVASSLKRQVEQGRPRVLAEAQVLHRQRSHQLNSNINTNSAHLGNHTLKISEFITSISLAGLLVGCAATEPPLLPQNNPADPQVRGSSKSNRNVLVRDETTLAIEKQLSATEADAKSAESMKHDMNNMEGMDHSKMQGMDMNKPPSGAPSPQPETMEGMDHSKMKGMTAPAPAASPANKEAVEMEMKKTSDEMKKLSDELKAKSDNAKRTKKTGGNSASTETSPAAAIYTCVMHPEVQQSTPGKCPICGMELIKKEAGQ